MQKRKRRVKNETCVDIYCSNSGYDCINSRGWHIRTADSVGGAIAGSAAISEGIKKAAPSRVAIFIVCLQQRSYFVPWRYLHRRGLGVEVANGDEVGFGVLGLTDDEELEQLHLRGLHIALHDALAGGEANAVGIDAG